MIIKQVSKKEQAMEKLGLTKSSTPLGVQYGKVQTKAY